MHVANHTDVPLHYRDVALAVAHVVRMVANQLVIPARHSDHMMK